MTATFAIPHAAHARSALGGQRFWGSNPRRWPSFSGTLKLLAEEATQRKGASSPPPNRAVVGPYFWLYRVTWLMSNASPDSPAKGAVLGTERACASTSTR